MKTAMQFAQDRADEKGISDDFWYETMVEFAQEAIKADRKNIHDHLMKLQDYTQAINAPQIDLK